MGGQGAEDAGAGRAIRIGVISDTHDFVPAALHGLLADADEIWHLGDVCDPSVLSELSTIGPPLTVVRGNNDWGVDWPLVRLLTRGSFRFQLIHIAPRRPDPGVDVLLHGHTHEPSDERLGGVRLLNPGALFRPRGGSRRGFAWLTVDGTGYGWKRVDLG